MLLTCQAVADQAVAEALCSVMLLEESSPRQALADFLLARKAAIQKLLNQQHHGGCGCSPQDLGHKPGDGAEQAEGGRSFHSVLCF